MAKANDTACDRTNHENHSANSTPDTRAPQEPAESIPETVQSDNERWKHSSLCIDTLLEKDDFDLLICCQSHPQGIDGIRRALTEQQTRGRKYLVTAMCDNVGPLGDCHGHDRQSDGSEPERPAAADIGDIDPSGEIYLATIDGVLQWVCDRKDDKMSGILDMLNNRPPQRPIESSARPMLRLADTMTCRSNTTDEES